MQAITPPTLSEQTSNSYTFPIIGDLDQMVNVIDMTALTLTLRDRNTGAIINNRQDQDVFQTNNVVVTTQTGPPLLTVATWLIQPADTPVVTPGTPYEIHDAIFRWYWDSGTRTQVHQMAFAIEHLWHLP